MEEGWMGWLGGFTDPRFLYEIFYGEFTNGMEFLRWMWYQFLLFAFFWLALTCCLTPLLVFVRSLRDLLLAAPRIDPRGRRVLVTGAASGIGLATARRLAALGCTVYAADINRPALELHFGPSASSSSSSSSAGGGEASGSVIPVAMDVTSERSVAEAAGFVRAQTDSLDGLVNCAGIIVPPENWKSGETPLGAVAEMPMASVAPIFDVNVFGMMRVTTAFYPLLAAVPAPGVPGCIVNVASVAGFSACPWLGPYSASKFAVVGYSDCLRRELYAARVRVACVEPGITNTPLLECTQLKNSSTVPSPLRDRAAVAQDRWRSWCRSPWFRQEPSAVGDEIADLLFHRSPPAHTIVDKWHLKFLWWIGAKLPAGLQDLVVGGMI